MNCITMESLPIEILDYIFAENRRMILVCLQVNRYIRFAALYSYNRFSRKPITKKEFREYLDDVPTSIIRFPGWQKLQQSPTIDIQRFTYHTTIKGVTSNGRIHIYLAPALTLRETSCGRRSSGKDSIVKILIRTHGQKNDTYTDTMLIDEFNPNVDLLTFHNIIKKRIGPNIPVLHEILIREYHYLQERTLLWSEWRQRRAWIYFVFYLVFNCRILTFVPEKLFDPHRTRLFLEENYQNLEKIRNRVELLYSRLHILLDRLV